MGSWVLTRARTTVWLGEGPLPYPECDLAARCVLANFRHFIWTRENYPKGNNLLEDMMKNGHYEIASEYLKIIALINNKGIYLDYNVMLTGPFHEIIPMASSHGMSFARHRPSYAGVDYLSTEIMIVPVVFARQKNYFVSYVLDYKSNFEYFYNQGERNPSFYGPNLFSRVYTNKILTREEAYGVPNSRTLEYRSDEITRLKRPIIPHTAFYAEPDEKHSPFVLGHVKPRLELTSAKREVLPA